MIGFELDDEQRKLRELAREVAAAVRPLARRWDEEEIFPEESLDILRSSGLLGLTVPIEHGGRGKGVLEACLVLEEIAAGCMTTAIVAQMFLNGPRRAVAVLGTAEQQARLLPGVARGERYFAIAMTEPGAGSSGTDLTTQLARGGDGVLRLTGAKCYITGGARADSFLVFCRAAGSSGARGIGAVVVERGQRGFDVVGTSPKMGSRGVAEASLPSRTSRSPTTRPSSHRTPSRPRALASCSVNSIPSGAGTPPCASGWRRPLWTTPSPTPPSGSSSGARSWSSRACSGSWPTWRSGSRPLAWPCGGPRCHRRTDSLHCDTPRWRSSSPTRWRSSSRMRRSSSTATSATPGSCPWSGTSGTSAGWRWAAAPPRFSGPSSPSR